MKNNVIRKWYLFVLGMVVSSVSFSIAVSLATAPKEDERIQFFVGAKDCKATSLREALWESKDSSIKEISITFGIEGSSTFSYVYQSVFSEMAFFVLPSSFFGENIEEDMQRFSVLSMDYLAKYSDTPMSFLEVAGKNKGILMHKKGEEKGIASSYIDYDKEEDYYLFFNANSPINGELSRCQNDAGLKAFGGLMGL